jgi:hypothetical protein
MNAAGKSKEFQRTFSGFVPRALTVVLSEVKTYGSTDRGEFIELYVVSGGNLAGMKLHNGYPTQEDDRTYTFPPIDVDAGEYIVVHYRKVGNDAVFIDETGSDLTLAKGPDTSDSARDLWVDTTDSRIATATDVILLFDSSDQAIDALFYAKSTAEKWPKAGSKENAQIASENGLWNGSDFASAVYSDSVGSSHKRTFSRHSVKDDDGAIIHGKAAWRLTSESTPGAPNSSQGL